ncbi:F-box protein SKIP1, partial [Tanacetum coccineum]
MLGRKCTNLSILKRNYIGIESMSESKKYIENVPRKYLNSRPEDGIRTALAIKKFMPELLHLELRFARISAPGLAGISKGCTKLGYLDLSGNSNFSDWKIKKATSNLTNLNVVNRKYNSFP